MQIAQLHLTTPTELPSDWSPLKIDPDFVLVFGDKTFFCQPNLAEQLKKQFPTAVIAGCSTSGEIAVDRVYENSCIVSAVKFASTQVKSVTTTLDSMDDSEAAGKRLGESIDHNDLTAVLILGTGVGINGSALVAGLKHCLPDKVRISGGLAGDSGAFTQTWTMDSQGTSCQQLVLVGRLAARLQLASPEAMLHPVLLGRILGLRDGEEVLVPVGGPPAPNHGPGLTLNGEASLGARRQYNLCKCK